MSSNPVPFTGVMTRSKSISQQQLILDVVQNEHESNVNNTPTNNILLSPITQHSPEKSSSPNQNQFSSPYSANSASSSTPSDISTRLEDTLDRNTNTPNNKDTSSFFISQLQLIGSETEDRIRNSQNSLQQQIANLTHKHDQLVLNNSNSFNRMSLQINHTSVILESILNRMSNTTHPNQQTNTIHSDPSPLVISNASITTLQPSQTSSSTSSTKIPLSVKELKTILENSVPIKSTPEIIKSYTPLLENNTPANILHSHEETCELYGLGIHTYVQLFLTNVKKNSLEIYEMFIQKTSLTRMHGRTKLDNPSAVDLANWSWTEFKLSFISIFEDPNLHLIIISYLNSWGPTTFTSFKLAEKSYIRIMRDIQFSKMNLSLSLPLSLPLLLQQNVTALKATINQTQASSIAIFVSTSNSLHPTNVIDMSYDILSLVVAQYTEFKLKEDAYYILNINKSKALSTTPSTTKPSRMNLIQTSVTCEFCNRKGHREAVFLKKNPELLKSFTCKICSQLGHVPYNCPNKQT